MTIKLEAKSRTVTGKKLFQLRAKSIIPAVVYGHGEKSQSIELDYVKFDKVYAEAGENTIIDLEIDGKAAKVLVADVQYDPVKNRIIHADLHKIKMNEKINANVELHFVGESKAVKEDGGSVNHAISEVEIRCLPADLIHGIEVDVSALVTFDDVIKISDLKVPANVEIVGHEDEDVVASVVGIQEEKEEVSAPAEGEAAPAEGEAKAEEKKEE